MPIENVEVSYAIFRKKRDGSSRGGTLQGGSDERAYENDNED